LGITAPDAILCLYLSSTQILDDIPSAFATRSHQLGCPWLAREHSLLLLIQHNNQLEVAIHDTSNFRSGQITA